MPMRSARAKRWRRVGVEGRSLLQQQARWKRRLRFGQQAFINRLLRLRLLITLGITPPKYSKTIPRLILQLQISRSSNFRLHMHMPVSLTAPHQK
jgi:hypothetical protein